MLAVLGETNEEALAGLDSAQAQRAEDTGQPSAAGQPAVSLDAATERRVLEKALTSRFVEERLLELFSEGKLNGTVHTCIGEEMTAVVSEFLRDGDTVFSNHRCHGHYLSRTGDIDGLIAELMGKATGVSGGFGGSQHLCNNGFYSNGIQGGFVPVAAGLAMGHKLNGTGGVSVAFIGDGTLGEGAVYEALNLASKWELPLLIVLEDNKYSQSTSQHETLAGNIRARAEAFGIETAHGDTWNWQGLYQTMGDVIGKMRVDHKPRFVQVETFRLKAHSKGDDSRPREVVAPFEERDPLNRFLAQVSAADQPWVDAIKARVQQAVDKAAQAELSAIPLPAPVTAAASWQTAQLPEGKRLVTVLNEMFAQLMREYPQAHFIGEDVLSPYGGAYKVSKGLSDTFPDRVRNTPISESAIVGLGIGMGMMGYLPMIEIMFGDFLGLAFDQLVNHAAKFQQMYNQQITTDVIVRTPMGGGRGYGPTHSQTLDRHFVGVPGLRVLAMNSLTRPEQLYRPLMRAGVGPTLVIENKLLYSSYLRSEAPEGFAVLHSDAEFPDVWVKPCLSANTRCDITLMGYGGTSEMLLEACERLFDEHDITAQVLSVMQIYPFSVQPLLPVLQAAPQLLIVEEGQGYASFGAEVITQLAEAASDQGLAMPRVGRVYPPAHCIPSSGPLEAQLLPSVDNIIEAAIARVRSA